MRIVYMGTPEFAVPPLLALLRGGYEVAAVFTQPDKPQGRRMTLTPPPVKIAAEKAGIPVFQPDTLRDPSQAQRIGELAPDAIALAAYGKILPQRILDIPKFGCVCVHPSLLPKYRGASPVQAAILNGDAETGVTIMRMSAGCDEGDILLQQTLTIDPDETTPELTERLSVLGAEMLPRALQGIADGSVVPTPQDASKSSYVSLITKKISPVDWKRSAVQIHNQVRALNPWPAASAQAGELRLKIFRTRPAGELAGEPGYIRPDKEGFFVCCGNGTGLEILELQADGGKRMSGSDFLRGHPLQGKTMG